MLQRYGPKQGAEALEWIMEKCGDGDGDDEGGDGDETEEDEIAK